MSESAGVAGDMERSLTLLVGDTLVTTRPDWVLQLMDEIDTFTVAVQRRVTPPPSVSSSGLGSLGVTVTSSGVSATKKKE